MDTDLKAYFDQHFGALDRRFDEIDQRFNEIDQRFNEIDQRFDGVDRRFNEIDQRFDGVDRRFNEIDQRFTTQIQELREETLQRFEQVDQRLERVETEVRHAHVLIENLEGKIRTVSEGVASVGERLDQFREEVSKKFVEVESLNRLSYKNLDDRVRPLEAAGGPWTRPPEI